MTTVKITAATIEYADLSPYSTIQRDDDYGRDFSEAIGQSPRDLEIQSNDELSGQDCKLVITLSEQFNTVSFALVPDNAPDAEPTLLTPEPIPSGQLIPKKKMKSAIEILKRQSELFRTGTPSQIEKIDMVRRESHSEITDLLEQSMKKRFPDLLQDYTEVRNFAGTLRALALYHDEFPEP